MTMKLYGGSRPLGFNPLTRVSAATRASGSTERQASRMASEMQSHSLSGCPAVTDSELNNLKTAPPKTALERPVILDVN